MSLGLRPFENRNLLNVKQSKGAEMRQAARWVGTDPVRVMDEKRHAVFLEGGGMMFGLRAGIYLLAVKQTQGLLTLEQVIGDPEYGWAPGDDGNDPEGYAAFVARRVRLGVNTRLDLFDGGDMKIKRRGTLEAILRAMVQMETFRGYTVEWGVMQSAVALYEHPDMPRPS